MSLGNVVGINQPEHYLQVLFGSMLVFCMCMTSFAITAMSRFVLASVFRLLISQNRTIRTSFFSVSDDLPEPLSSWPRCCSWWWWWCARRSARGDVIYPFKVLHRFTLLRALRATWRLGKRSTSWLRLSIDFGHESLDFKLCSCEHLHRGSRHRTPMQTLFSPFTRHVACACSYWPLLPVALCPISL